MGLQFENLDAETRRYMLEEIAMDELAGTVNLSTWLNQSGQGQWTDALKEAASGGDDATLASAIRRDGLLAARILRRKPKGGSTWSAVPYNANETLAEIEFNRYYVRALCRIAIARGIPRLEVYRAKAVAVPRPESVHKIGKLIDPVAVIADVRATNGFETALGMPQGPNSGLTLRIPN